MQGFLSGRKVTDAGGKSRSSIYVVSTANSAVGKNHPRSICRRILYECGLADCCGDEIASGPGLEDALFARPSLFLLSDEIHFLFAAMKDGRDVRWQGIANVLLKFFTSADDVYVMRLLAKNVERKTINQPALTMSATTTPRQFYNSLSVDVLTNGLFGRLIILNADPRGRAQAEKDRAAADNH